MEPRRSRKYSDDEDWAPSVPVVTTCRVTRSQVGTWFANVSVQVW